MTKGAPPNWLDPPVDLVCLDAGNTVVFLDHERLAASAARAGFPVSADDIEKAEDAAMRAVFRKELAVLPWSRTDVPAARGWGVFVGMLLVAAGADPTTAPAILDALWEEHIAYNFWCKVPEGLPEALEAARRADLRLVVVSNSEGKLDALFTRLGILGLFDHVVDSGVVGIEKPDPRIFRIALQAARASPSRSVHLGDSPADVEGALAADLRVALIDPRARLEGLYPDTPRVGSAREVLQHLVRRRRG